MVSTEPELDDEGRPRRDDPRDYAQPIAPERKRHWLPWVIGAAILLALLLIGPKACAERDAQRPAAMPDAAVGESADAGVLPPAGADGAAGGTAGGAAVFTSESLRGYLRETGGDPAGRAFALDRVTFDSGSSSLDAGDRAVIGEVAAVLKEFPGAAATVTAYADPAGDAASNRKLAAARAVAVKDALAGAGVARERLLTNVVGETGTAAIAENRRVELLVKRG